MGNITLRGYQQECIDLIPERGRYLVQMATGLGKSLTFSRVPRIGKALILSHREELVRQPLRYYDCSTSVEMAGKHADHSAEVISASVQSIARRLDMYRPDEFDIVVVDEAHHASAPTYRKILDYFKPRLLLGFTATPNRADKVRLNDVFDDIIFKRDLKWGIKNGYLSDVYCRRVDIDYDLSAVHVRHGDFAPGELDLAMTGTEAAIAEVYRKYAEGATLIFASSVRHAEAICAAIGEDAVCVTGQTKNRSELILAFTARRIRCLVNCMVFTEGTDMPLIETIIIARPTKSDSLYTQMVGRGLRLHPDKTRLNLIDCVGITGRRNLCTAPSLLGVSLDEVPEKNRTAVQGDLFELEYKATLAADCPQGWIKNVEVVDLWSREQGYDLHDVAWFKMPDGTMVLNLPDFSVSVSAPDELGRVLLNGKTQMEAQEAYDSIFKRLYEFRQDCRHLWDRAVIKRWAGAPASDKQKDIIRRRCKEFDPSDLTKGEASLILNRLFANKKWR